MLLKLQQAGQPVLRRKSRRVSRQQLASKQMQDLIDSMVATLRDAPGVGLAAPQVGEPVQIIIIEDRAKYHEPLPPKLLKEQGRKPVRLKVLVNPSLAIVDPKTDLYFEGCLSLDGYAAAVSRARSVKVTAWDRNGKEISFTADGWLARILQHEVDHLHGSLYIDRMVSTSFMTIKNFTLHWRSALQTKIRQTFPAPND